MRGPASLYDPAFPRHGAQDLGFDAEMIYHSSLDYWIAKLCGQPHGRSAIEVRRTRA